MTAALAHISRATALPELIDRASRALAGARSSAEILEARDMASAVYTAAKSAARLAKAKGAHDALIAAAHRAQADALEIEAGAKRRLADEYDAAQERGDVASGRGPGRGVSILNGNTKATVTDIGLSSKEIHEARTIRDAEANDPGIIRRTLAEKLDAGEEPTKAALREAVTEAAMRGLRGKHSASRRNPHYVPPTPAEKAWSYLYGEARGFREWATAENIKLALKGMKEREDSQVGNVRAVRECAAVFSKIVERFDA